MDDMLFQPLAAVELMHHSALVPQLLHFLLFNKRHSPVVSKIVTGWREAARWQEKTLKGWVT